MPCNTCSILFGVQFPLNAESDFVYILGNAATQRHATDQALRSNIDAILKAAVLMAPPEECVPPKSLHSESSMDAIQAFGLDLEEDSESSSLGKDTAIFFPLTRSVHGGVGLSDVLKYLCYNNCYILLRSKCF